MALWTQRPTPGAGLCHVCGGCPGRPFGQGCLLGHVLVLSLEGEGRLRFQGAELEVAPRRRAALLPAPGPDEAPFAVTAPFRALSLRLDHLQQRLDVLLGAHGPEPLRIDAQVRLDEAPGADLQRLIDLIVAVYPAEQGALGAPPILAGLLESLGTALLLCQRSNYSARLERAAAQGAPPREVRLAQAYIDAHFAEALRVEDVARAAGVGLRALQEAFRRHGGRSLSEALRERRLDHARRLLTEAEGATVAQVALDCGMAHLGRFSTEYRRRFGESPSETLRKARPRPRLVKRG